MALQDDLSNFLPASMDLTIERINTEMFSTTVQQSCTIMTLHYQFVCASVVLYLTHSDPK
jgi:hypothetical protein